MQRRALLKAAAGGAAVAALAGVRPQPAFALVGPTYFNVRDYGAVPDGNVNDGTIGTDNAAAFQACHDAMPAGGGVFVKPAGVYRIASGVTLSKPGAYLGDGSAATTIMVDSLAADGLTFTQWALPGYTTVRGFTVKSTRTGRTGSGLKIPGGGYLVDDVWSQGHRNGFWVQGWANAFRHCMGINSSIHGCWFDSSIHPLNEMEIENCEFNANGGSGLRMDGVHGGLGMWFTRITGASNGQHGISSATGDFGDVFLTAPELSGNGLGAASILGGSKWEFNGGLYEGGSAGPIVDLALSGMVIMRGGYVQGGAYGVRLATNDLTLDGTIITLATQAGLQVAGGRHIQLRGVNSGNSAAGSTQKYGIQWLGGSQITMSGGDYSNNTLGAYLGTVPAGTIQSGVRTTL